jgi:thiosulfate reductase cytochrome b subunit
MSQMDAIATPAAPATPAAVRPPREIIYRHRLVTRITHWINVLAISLLLMSGLQIFNAHPRLYWGQFGADADRPFIELTADMDAAGDIVGVTRIGPLTLQTTGLLGASKGANGEIGPRGFPAWLTLPSYQDLATGRRWHFFAAWLLVANGAIYLAYGAFSGHFRRDLALTRAEVAPRHILRDIWDHLRFKHPTGEAAKRYNTLQKFAYLGVVFGVLPLIVATGLTMSPGVDAALPFLLDIFGGRQSARTLHFICANLIVLFVIVHVVEVFLAGVWNEIRSMITGWYVVKPEASDGRH